MAFKLQESLNLIIFNTYKKHFLMSLCNSIMSGFRNCKVWYSGTLVLHSISRWCFLIGVGFFGCHVPHPLLTVRESDSTVYERQYLMSSIVGSTTSWMIACQAYSSCLIYLTQVSILKSSSLSQHHWYEIILLSRSCTQIKFTAYMWSI